MIDEIFVLEKAESLLYYVPVTINLALAERYLTQRAYPHRPLGFLLPNFS